MVLTVAWEAAGALVARCSTSSAQSGVSTEYLRSRGIDLLPLSTLCSEVHPLAIDMWSLVTDLSISSMTSLEKSSKSGASATAPSPTSLLEAACLAASHWLALSVHLTTTLVAAGIPRDIKLGSLISCLGVFSKLLQHFSQESSPPLPASVDLSLKVEIFSGMLKSNVLKLITQGYLDYECPICLPISYFDNLIIMAGSSRTDHFSIVRRWFEPWPATNYLSC